MGNLHSLILTHRHIDRGGCGEVWEEWRRDGAVRKDTTHHKIVLWDWRGEE